MSKKAQIITHGSLQLVLLLLAVLISGETIPFPARGVTGDTFFLGMSVLIGNTLLYVSYNLLEMEDFGALGLLKKACTVIGYVLTIGGGALTSFIFAMDTLKMDMGKVAGCPWAYAFGGIYWIAAVISSVLYAFVDPDSTVYPFATVISLGISYLISLGFVFFGINVARFFMAMCPFILVVVVAGVAIFAIAHGGGEIKILTPGARPPAQPTGNGPKPTNKPIDIRKDDQFEKALKIAVGAAVAGTQIKMSSTCIANSGRINISVDHNISGKTVYMHGHIEYKLFSHEDVHSTSFNMDVNCCLLENAMSEEAKDAMDCLVKNYKNYDDWSFSVSVDGRYIQE